MAENDKKLAAANKEATEAGTRQHDSTIRSGSWAFVAVGVVVLTVLATVGLRIYSYRGPTASRNAAHKTFVLSMPPNGDSQRFSVGTGETPHYVGERPLEIRWQCSNGKVSKESDPKGTWCQGAIMAYWMHDLSGSANSATITIR